MASRGSIHLSIIFFFLAILPLLASAFPGFFHVENSNSPFQNDGVKTFFGAPIFRGKGENEEASLPSDDVGEQEKPLKYESRTKEETGVKGTTKGRLREGFYEKTCPQAELIVNDVMNKAFQNDSGLAAALLRLFFHDCFVTVSRSCLYRNCSLTDVWEKYKKSFLSSDFFTSMTCLLELTRQHW